MELYDWFLITTLNIFLFGSLWVIGKFIEMAFQRFIDNYDKFINKMGLQ